MPIIRCSRICSYTLETTAHVTKKKLSLDNRKFFFQHHSGDFSFSNFCQDISSFPSTTHTDFGFLLNNCIFFINLFFFSFFFEYITAKNIIDRCRLKICSRKIKLCKENKLISSAEKQFNWFIIKTIKRLLVSTTLFRNSQ